MRANRIPENCLCRNLLNEWRPGQTVTASVSASVDVIDSGYWARLFLSPSLTFQTKVFLPPYRRRLDRLY